MRVNSSYSEGSSPRQRASPHNTDALPAAPKPEEGHSHGFIVSLCPSSVNSTSPPPKHRIFLIVQTCSLMTLLDLPGNSCRIPVLSLDGRLRFSGQRGSRSQATLSLHARQSLAGKDLVLASLPAPSPLVSCTETLKPILAWRSRPDRWKVPWFSVGVGGAGFTGSHQNQQPYPLRRDMLSALTKPTLKTLEIRGLERWLSG